MRLAVLLSLVILGGVAHAYPQYQLSRDKTCTACHLSPAGGNLLSENGYAVAEAKSHLGTAPEFMYGKLGTPDWLTLGGDVRIASGYFKTPEKTLATFPMQIELYAGITLPSGFSLHTNFGPRPSNPDNKAATSVWAREHYLMWQQKPGETEGLYVRAGRFMPVIGLRLAEHPVYTRRCGGTALYAETYGLAIEYVSEKFEVHATGFIKDPIIASVEHYSGGAGYLEYRITDKLAIGAEGMAEVSVDDKRYRGGLTAKAYIEPADLLIQGEAQFVNQLVDSADGRGAPKMFVGYLMLTRMLGEFLMVDVGFGGYDPNLRLGENERLGGDLNLHYFTTSHLELVLNSRYEKVGDQTGAYAMMQLHYRL